MTVVRYINGERLEGEGLPPVQVENPGVVLVLRGLRRRLAGSPGGPGTEDTSSPEGCSPGTYMVY